MKSRRLLIYALLLTAALGGYYLLEVRHPAQKAQRESLDRRILDLDIAGIEKIRIHGDEDIVLQLSADGWNILEPLACRADKREVAGLLDAIATLEYERHLENVADREPFALHPGLSVATATAAHDIEFGRQNPAGNLCYVACSGRDGVFLVDVYGVYRLQTDVMQLRDKQLSVLNREAIEKVSISRDGVRFEVVRVPEEGWQLPGEGAPGLKQSLVERLMFRLAAAEALAFPSVPAAELGAADIMLKIYGAGQTEEIRIWDRRTEQGKVFALSSRSKEVMEVDPALLDAVPEDLRDIVDRGVAHIPEDEISLIVLKKSEKRFEIRRDGGNFSCAGRPVDAAAVIELLGLISGLEYDAELLSLPSEAALCETILLFAAEEKTPAFDINLYTNYYVALNGRYYRVDEKVFRQLKSGTATLRMLAGDSEVDE